MLTSKISCKTWPNSVSNVSSIIQQKMINAKCHCYSLLSEKSVSCFPYNPQQTSMNKYSRIPEPIIQKPKQKQRTKAIKNRRYGDLIEHAFSQCLQQKDTFLLIVWRLGYAVEQIQSLLRAHWLRSFFFHCYPDRLFFQIGVF